MDEHPPEDGIRRAPTSAGEFTRGVHASRIACTRPTRHLYGGCRGYRTDHRGAAGLGLEFAWQLATARHDLVLVDRDSEGLERLAGQLPGAAGVHVETLVADLSVRSDVERVAERLRSTERPVGLLVNNAGERPGSGSWAATSGARRPCSTSWSAPSWCFARRRRGR